MFSVLPEGANRIRFNVTDLGWNNSLSFMIDYMETEKISGNENAEIVVEAEEWLSASHTPSVYKSSVSSGEKKIQLAPAYPAEIELEKVTKSFEISGDMIKFILLSDEEKLMPAIGAVFAKGANAAQRPVTFWGDSITAGAGGWTGAEEFPDSYKQSGIVKYPLVTEALSGLKTTNLAVGGENATEIAARQGAVDIVMTSDVSLPAEAGAKTEISLKAANNISCYPLYFDQNDSTSGINPCKINGIEGKLSIVYDSEDSQTRTKQGSKYYFERLENGEAAAAAAGDRIITNAAEKRNSDMLVICMGTNGGRCQGYTINFFNFVHFV